MVKRPSQKRKDAGSNPVPCTNTSQVDEYGATICDYGGVITRIMMGPEEIDYVAGVIAAAPDDALIVEWGSGGSSCRWYEAMRAGQKMTVIEHCQAWHDKVAQAAVAAFGAELVKPESPGFELVQCTEHPDVARVCYSEPYRDKDDRLVRDVDFHKEEAPAFMPHYISPRDDVWDADVFLVDGICRGPVLATILAKHRKRAPVILLHDYPQREVVYDWAVHLFPATELVRGTILRLYV